MQKWCQRAGHFPPMMLVPSLFMRLARTVLSTYCLVRVDTERQGSMILDLTSISILLNAGLAGFSPSQVASIVSLSKGESAMVRSSSSHGYDPLKQASIMNSRESPRVPLLISTKTSDLTRAIVTFSPCPGVCQIVGD